MPEDAGKKRDIRDFLQRIKAGEGFNEDIWINRSIRPPGSTGEGSTARSLSGKSISNVVELLEDDIRHCFEDNYFTFRVVSALKGSGKTALITYLYEFIKTQRLLFRRNFIICRFSLTSLTSMGGVQDFAIKFYCYILSETFWKLIKDSSVENATRLILEEYLGKPESTQLVSSSRLASFRSQFIKYFSDLSVDFEELFFDLINDVTKVEPKYTFAYLIDEFDALENKPNERQQMLTIIRSLIKRASQQFGAKISLFVYFVGTSENVKALFAEDPVIESLIGRQVIDLNAGYTKEFDEIKDHINSRIEGAYKGFKDFDKAWQQIRNIPSSPEKTLRGFYQYYASEVLIIHERYFSEEPEKRFEGNARDLVESKCRQKWSQYLSKASYTLSPVSTTTVLAGHAFDCYVQLLHNGNPVARCFGEAKNYELLSSHLETFSKWLEDADFEPHRNDDLAPDLAFMIAPSCPFLLKRKLELKNIEFIQAEKIIDAVNTSPPTSPPLSRPTGINSAGKAELVDAFKGSRIREATIDKLIIDRGKSLYRNLNDLAARLKLTASAKSKLQAKLDNHEISFD